MPGDGVVDRIRRTSRFKFSAVAVAPDETVWAGGTSFSFFGGMVFKVSPEGSIVVFRGLHDNVEDEIEDLVFDDLERLHVVLFSRQPGQQPSGAGVLDQEQLTLCQTVNAFDVMAYPFLAPSGEACPSSRALAATNGDIWLFGSDGGVGRVADTFRDNPCRDDVMVQYDPIYRRDTHPSLPINTVPTLVVASDETL